MTFLHYFGPQGIDAIRSEFRLSFNQVEFTLQSLITSAYVREVDEADIYVSTGRWNPESDVRKSG